ncbi:MAG TPA: holo-ACP synthase [Bacteroidota bacterium]|nr:holo-ACP synthase [Bacteroidota bacterium]
MIAGIGVDIVEIDRIASALERYGDAFASKLFTEQEISYCRAKALPAQHFAARFAAKEAFSKAIATGWSGTFHWKDVEVVNDEFGKPCVNVYGDTARRIGSAAVSLSLSHTGTNAVAFVVIES